MAASERDQVITAVKDLGRRVTVGDVAAKTGLPLLSANRALNGVAADCRATIQVTKEGNLVYAFSPAFESAYLQTGVALALQKLGATSFQAAYYLLRISFGITLIGSVVTVSVLIVVAIIAVINGSNNSSSGGGGNGDSGGGLDFDLSCLADIGRFFCWDLSYRGVPYHDYSQPSFERDYAAYTQGKYIPAGETQDKGQGFVLDCFSYLFGDGDPNEHIDDHKWQLIAEHIRRNQGVATVEQLTCYTGGNPQREDEALPVLVRFDGQPAVTETGNIVYVFPSMQVSAAAPPVVPDQTALPPFLEEKRWEFSLQKPVNMVPVGIFAILNFAGCMWLLGHMSKIAVLGHYRVLIDYLSIYAAFFIFFPILRYFGLQFINAKTKLRNDKRKKNFAVTRQKKHLHKLAEASAFTVSAPSTTNIVYSTDKDILEQQFDAPF